MSCTIGFFDSGIGGLAIYKEVRSLLPANVSTVYIADYAYMPYGSKTEKEVRKRAYTLSDILINTFNADIVVVACNTASVTAVDWLRLKFPSTLFVGVVPVVKPASAATKTGKIAILGTPITVNSNYIDNRLIANFASDKQIFKIGSVSLVEAIENGFNISQIERLLKEYLEPIVSEGVDVVGLSCTHYIFIKDIINNLYPNLKVIEPARPVALQVLRLYNSIRDKADFSTSYHKFYFTYSKNAKDDKKRKEKELKDKLKILGMHKLFDEISVLITENYANCC